MNTELFSERLRSCRVLRGMSQAELARRADLTQPMISQYEAGRTVQGVTAGTVLKLAKELGVTASWLLGEDTP